MPRVDSTDRRSLDIALPVAERQGYLDGNPSLNLFRWGTTHERLHPRPDGVRLAKVSLVTACGMNVVARLPLVLRLRPFGGELDQHLDRSLHLFEAGPFER